MDDASEPNLAPPGAGLPKVELFIARAIFAWKGRKATREGVNALFKKERDTIGMLARSIDADAGGRRILIRRLPGMEDSSRYWSVWMTLEHLRLVHQMAGRIIDSLVRGVLPPGKASTAAVKPRADVTATVIAEYEKSCNNLLGSVIGAPDLKTTIRYEHPWFGPLDAAGWHMVIAGHLGIHRTQIEQIIHGLGAKS